MEALNFGARVIAVCIATIIWVFIVLPIWIFMLLREVCVSAFYVVATNFGATMKTYDAKRLDIISAFWAAGLKKIFALLSDSPETSGTLTQESFSRLMSETILAIMFYLSFAWVPGLFYLGFRYLREAGDSLDAYVPAWIAPFIALSLILLLGWAAAFGIKRMMK